MILEALNRSLQKLGYEVRRVPRTSPDPSRVMPPSRDQLPAIEPRWPLPVSPAAGDPAWIREQFARWDLWHYAYRFEGGLDFANRHKHPGAVTDDSLRAVQRFRHFMPSLVHAAGGSLAGKRVLDIACNSGFWSIQCALLGADVVGFDARQELIDQANLIKQITGVENARFQLLDFWSMSPEVLGGQFDIVLNLGILYHLPDSLRAMQLTRAMARDVIMLDSMVMRSGAPVLRLKWEDPSDIRDATNRGVVMHPSKAAVEMLIRHLGVRSYYEVPIRSEMPSDYRTGGRASWVIQV